MFSQLALLYGGPALAFIGLLVCFIPGLRPARMLRTLAWICAAASLSIAMAAATNSGFLLLILRPATIFLGLIAVIAYFRWTRRFHLPVQRLLCPALLLAASLADGWSLYLMTSDSFGGASC